VSRLDRWCGRVTKGSVSAGTEKAAHAQPLVAVAPARPGSPRLGSARLGPAERDTRLRHRVYDDAMSDSDIAGLKDHARSHLDAMIDLRRTLHTNPELGNDLPITRDEVLQRLDGLPLDITLHSTTSGIAAVLDGGKPGPTVLLRGDMDALPLHEDTGLDFTSRIDGQMHACGHDLHTSMLVGAAKVLSERQAELSGRVLFMFQPGEEGFGGADLMLNEGLLALGPRADGEPSPVTGAFALHVTSVMPTGMVAVKGGPAMASADSFVCTVTGRGGHASAPHHALDPIPIACEIVQAWQLMITRRIDVFDPGVLTVGRITAGTTNNVIPETAEIEGTIRAFSERTRAKIHEGLRRVAEGIAAAHDATVSVDLHEGYPVTANDAAFADFSLSTAQELLGDGMAVRMPNPVMGAEDFSYVLNRVPGAMMFLGGTHPERNPFTAPMNHSNYVWFDEEAMVNGTAMYAAVAIRHLTTAAS
jgi:amidohydrolase